MKKLKVETIVKFRDLKAGKIREIGEQFTVSKERCGELEKRGYVKKIKDESQVTAAE